MSYSEHRLRGRFILMGFIGLMFVEGSLAHEAVHYSFSALWKLVQEQSSRIREVSYDLEAARIYKKRMSRHWYPRVFLEGRTFLTDDAPSSMVNLLGQRQMTTSDFVPQELNRPGHHLFQKASIGFDLPLFEGGGKSALVESLLKASEAKFYELKSVKIAQYVELTLLCASMSSLQKQREQLQKFLKLVSETLSHYQVGLKSNPVGHAGLLGLKTLRNRIIVSLNGNEAQSISVRARVHGLAEEIPEDWVFDSDNNVVKFLSKYLPFKEDQIPEARRSYLIQSVYSEIESLEKTRSVEKAQVLPKIGLFGSENLYNSKRGFSSSYTAGAYIQWDLFSLTQSGATLQIDHKIAAARARAKGQEQKIDADLLGSVKAVSELEKNLLLIEETEQLLEEQGTVAKKLFQNGSISALNFVDTISRRVDLVEKRSEVELSLAHSRANIVVYSNQEDVLCEN